MLKKTPTFKKLSYLILRKNAVKIFFLQTPKYEQKLTELPPNFHKT